MKAYGYKINGKRRLNLKEVTFSSDDISEICKMVEFLKYVKQESDKYSKAIDRDNVHSWQSKDWDKEWKESFNNFTIEVLFD